MAKTVCIGNTGIDIQVEAVEPVGSKEWRYIGAGSRSEADMLRATERLIGNAPATFRSMELHGGAGRQTEVAVICGQPPKRQRDEVAESRASHSLLLAGKDASGRPHPINMGAYPYTVQVTHRHGEFLVSCFGRCDGAWLSRDGWGLRMRFYDEDDHMEAHPVARLEPLSVRDCSFRRRGREGVMECRAYAKLRHSRIEWPEDKLGSFVARASGR